MSESPSSEYQQQIKGLEQQIQSLTQQVNSLTGNNQKSVARAPKIYETNITHTMTIPNPGMIFGSPGNHLKFSAETGNRVEGEITIIDYYLKIDPTFAGNPYGFGGGFVFDPYRNVIVQFGCLIQDGHGVIRGYSTGRVKHAIWQFAFVAATTGEYELEVYVGCTKVEYITNPPPVVGTIKVTVYND
jgi:hypothetical protein